MKLDNDDLTAGALYNGAGCAIADQPIPPFDGPDGIVHTRPVCRILSSATELDEQTQTTDLIYVLPIGAGPHVIDAPNLAEMVACIDRGGRIALHGSHDLAVTAAINTILIMSGGARA